MNNTARVPMMNRRVPLWVAVVTGVVSLVIGLTPGMAAYSDARAEIVLLEGDLESAIAASNQSRLDLEEALQEFTEEHKTLNAAIKDAELSLDEANQLVKAAEKKAKIANERAETAEAQAAAAEQAIQPVAEEPAPASAPQFAASPESSNSDTYYENCTAARNAGAAPVYASDPGYGRHLDRDGDGVGCE